MSDNNNNNKKNNNKTDMEKLEKYVFARHVRPHALMYMKNMKNFEEYLLERSEQDGGRVLDYLKYFIREQLELEVQLERKVLEDA